MPQNSSEPPLWRRHEQTPQQVGQLWHAGTAGHTLGQVTVLHDAVVPGLAPVAAAREVHSESATATSLPPAVSRIMHVTTLLVTPPPHTTLQAPKTPASHR